MKQNFLPYFLSVLSFASISIISVITPAKAQQTVVCESDKNQTEQCYIDTSNGIRLDQQLSKTSCNGKWQVGEDYVEVRDGCRARFVVDENSNSNSDSDSEFDSDSNPNEVVCNSNDGKRKRCAIDTSNGVRLDEQISNSSCNGKWAVGNEYVEVWGNCRARFVSIGKNNNNNRAQVLCESNDNQRKRCGIDTNNGVRLDEQISKTSCNGKWRVGDNYVEVWGNCRARFASIGRNTNNSRDRVVCESNNRKRERCNIDTSRGVRLVRNNSSNSCENNWSMGNGYVEVWNNCRAEFAANNNNNSSNLPRKVTCESNENQRERCPIDTSRTVRLSKKLSSSSCNNNWRVGNNYVEVINGCRAEFTTDQDK